MNPLFFLFACRLEFVAFDRCYLLLVLAHRLLHRLNAFTSSKYTDLTRFMAAQPVDAVFCVSWLLGLQPKSSPSPVASASSQHLTKDPDFSVSWLLGISGYQTLEEEISIWIKENESDNPHFRVSWLLGLEPRPGRCWGWAAQYENEDPSFLGVSHILGLIPTPEDPVEPEAEEEESESEEEEEEETVEEVIDEDDEMGLQRLFGELPYVVEDEEEQKAEEEQPTEAPVVATQEFLDLCAQMDEMISALEYAPSIAQISSSITNRQPEHPT